MKYVKYLHNTFGSFAVIEEGNHIVTISIDKPILTTSLIEKNTPLLEETAKQLTEYFEGKRKIFTVPLNPSGTPFMQKVWKALQDISYGEVKTYKDIAISIDNPKACRAIGMANHNNPIPIIIPCHRVIGASGNLVGYGLGLEKKKFLLNLEKNHLYC